MTKPMIILPTLLALWWGFSAPERVQAQGATNSKTAGVTAVSPVAGRVPDSMELRFLEGRITAKEYQRFLRRQKPPVVLPEITNTPPQVKVLESITLSKPVLSQSAPPFPYTNAPVTEAEAEAEADDGEASLGTVEARMQALLRLKEERERDASAGSEEVDPALPRRDRLDALLRLFIRKKISEEDYNKQRDQILKEPEG